jgi:hypothetical protein
VAENKIDCGIGYSGIEAANIIRKGQALGIPRHNLQGRLGCSALFWASPDRHRTVPPELLRDSSVDALWCDYLLASR